MRLAPPDFTRGNDDIEPPLEPSLASQPGDDLVHSVREHGRATSACAERRRDVPCLGPIIAPRFKIRIDQIGDDVGRYGSAEHPPPVFLTCESSVVIGPVPPIP